MDGEVSSSDALEELRTQNLAALAALRAQGSDLDRLGVFHHRINLVIDWLLPDESDERLAFEIEYEKKMAAILAQASSEVMRRRLSAPIPPNLPGLVIPRG